MNDVHEDDFFHECAGCGAVEPCTKSEWDTCEGRGDEWFCSDDCASEVDGERALDFEDDARAEARHEREVYGDF